MFRETVRILLKEIDPEGVDRRSRKILKRRSYFQKVCIQVLITYKYCITYTRFSLNAIVLNIFRAQIMFIMLMDMIS